MRGRVFTAEDFRVPRGYFELLVGADVAADLLGPTGGAVIPSRQFLNLCLELMQRQGDESLGSAPFRVPCGTFGVVLAAAAQGDTFGEALQRFSAASAVVRPDLSVTLSRSRRGLSLTYDYVGERSARRDLMLDIFAVTAHCGFRWLTGRRLRPTGLRVAPPTPPMGPTLLKPVLARAAQGGGSGVTVVYPADDADAPLRPVKYQHWAAHELDEFTALMDETARDYSEDTPAVAGIVGRVRGVIGPDGWSETAAARALGMSTATLRRRLSEAGASFRGLSSEVRRTMAQSLLATEQSLDEIAERLGFSDTRSFRRACHAWFGMSPAAWRKQAR